MNPRFSLPFPKAGRLFNDPLRIKRYCYALLMITAMVAVAEITGEKEIIFPEMAALTIGLWIVDKRVWQITKPLLIGLLTAGATAGVCLVRYSPLPPAANLALAFTFAALCLALSRTTLIPVLSACMLPVLLHTESWVYPAAVGVMACLLAAVQTGMEKIRLRTKTGFTPPLPDWKNETVRWLFLLGTVSLVAVPAIYTAHLYLILPPLIVTYVELATSKAGFRNRPLQVFLFIEIAALAGTIFQLAAHVYCGLPESVTALFLFLFLFYLFERVGKFFAPAGAIALIPMLLPAESLWWYPLQVGTGALLFILLAFICFQKCYKWTKSQLIVCLVPAYVYHKRKYKTKNKRE